MVWYLKPGIANRIFMLNFLYFVGFICISLVSFLAQIGKSDPSAYPIQKKRATREFLRTIAHLRPRTNTFGAV